MKGFALDSNGDLLIQNNEIQMVHGAELTRQSTETVLGTKKGEWSLNVDEGIDFDNILGKKVDEDITKSTVQDGLTQVDDTFVIDEFEQTHDKAKRKLSAKFKAHTENGETVEVVKSWA